MTAMTRDEFIAKTMTVNDADTLSRFDWAGAAGSIAAAISMAPDNFSKEGIVEALQELALKMPAELIQEATMRLLIASGGL